MVQLDKTRVLDGIAVVVPRLQMWGATKKANREQHFREAAAKMPPTSIVSNGEVRLVNKKHMEWCGKYRKRLERLIKTYGTRTFAGDIVPIEEISEIVKELDGFTEDFEKDVAQFVSDLPDYLTSWKKANPEWIELFDQYTIDPAAVRGAFNFRYTVFRPSAVEGHEDNVSELTQSIAQSVATEIALQGRQTWDKSIRGRGKITPATLNVYHKMVKKLTSFSLIDPVLRPVAEMLQSTLDAVPNTGSIEGTSLLLVERAALVLTDPERILTYGQVIEDDDVLSPTSYVPVAQDTKQGELLIPSEPAQSPSRAPVPAKPKVPERRLPWDSQPSYF